MIPGKKLSYTHAWDSVLPNGQPARPDYRAGDTAVIFWTLEELPDRKTRVTLVQTGIDPTSWPGTDAGRTHWMEELVHHSVGRNSSGHR